MSQQTTYKPGELAPKTGDFTPMKPNGDKTGKPVHMPKGNHFPPTPGPKQVYRPGR